MRDNVRIWQTSRNAGPGHSSENLVEKAALAARDTVPAGRITIEVDESGPRQKIHGIGGSLTETTAKLIMDLPADKQQAIVDALFAPAPLGNGFSLARTCLGGSDFSAGDYYTYQEAEDSPFSIARDERYVLPMIRRALQASRGELKVISSPWSAPVWMKDPAGKDQHPYKGRPLKPGCYGAFADYFVRFISAYKEAGVDLWAITPTNEPLLVDNIRMSMFWNERTMLDFLRVLVSRFKAAGLAQRIYIYDHNKGPLGAEMDLWTKTILGDPGVKDGIAGTAVHWYNSSWQTYEDTLDVIHDLDPAKEILFTEGTNDGLTDVKGIELGSEGYRYSWWKNDDYYWQKVAYEWGHWWAPGPDHTPYFPIYRYLRDIIVGLNHWYTGWIDWNAVLTRDGGMGVSAEINPCMAPVMVDPGTNEVYFTPILSALGHFSRFMRPGATVMTVRSDSPVVNPVVTKDNHDSLFLVTAAKNVDGSMVVVLFNETMKPIEYSVVVASKAIDGILPGQSVQTQVWR